MFVSLDPHGQHSSTCNYRKAVYKPPTPPERASAIPARKCEREPISRRENQPIGKKKRVWLGPVPTTRSYFLTGFPVRSPPLAVRLRTGLRTARRGASRGNPRGQRYHARRPRGAVALDDCFRACGAEDKLLREGALRYRLECAALRPKPRIERLRSSRLHTHALPPLSGGGGRTPAPRSRRHSPRPHRRAALTRLLACSLACCRAGSSLLRAGAGLHGGEPRHRRRHALRHLLRARPVAKQQSIPARFPRLVGSLFISLR